MHPGLSAWSCTMRNQKLYIYIFYFFFSRLPGTKHLSSRSHSHLPAGWMEKGAEVGRCRASTGRGCTGVTVATAIKTGLRIKSVHRAPQTLARCDWVDRIYLFILLFFIFFHLSSWTKMLETVTQHNSPVWTCKTGRKTADRQRVPCRKRSTKLLPVTQQFSSSFNQKSVDLKGKKV